MASGKGKNWVYYILIGLIVLGFGGWFTNGGGGRRTAIGTVGGLELGAQDYATALRNQMRTIEGQTGEAMRFADAQAMGLDRAVLGRLVADRTLDAEAARLGLSVGDARVAQAVRGMDAFQGLDGQFDRALYRDTLRRNGTSEADFEQSLRDDTTRTILQAAIVGGLPEPDVYGDRLAARSNERRSATWAVVAPAAAPAQPSEDDLRAFHAANPALFTAPETRTIRYAWATPTMLLDAQPVPDEDVRALYDERRDQFVQEERRLVERLVMPTDEAAADARARLDAGEATFEDLVAARGLQLSDTDLGDVARGDLDGAADAVFAAAAGDVVGPVQTPLGPAFFRVNAVLAADEIPFEEAAPDLRAEIADAAARRAIAALSGDLEDLVAGGATTADIAERTDLDPGEAAVTAEAGDGPAAYAEVRDAAFAMDAGDLPEIVELADGGVAVIEVDAVAPPALRPFDEARADVEDAWQAQARRDATLDRAEAAAEAIAGGASFEDQGLDPMEEAGLDRRSAIEGTGPDTVPAVFAMQPGEARAIPTPEGAIVLRLDAVDAADLQDETVRAEAAAIADEVSGAIAQDLFSAFAGALQAGTEIRIDDRAVAAVNAQMN